MSKLFHLTGDRIEKTDGTFAAGAKIYFWEAGTSTLLDTYSDNALSSANTNPVVCDANGLVPAIFLQDKLYKYQITDADDNVLVSAVDNYDGGDSTETIDAGTAGGTADALTLTVAGVTEYTSTLKFRFIVASDNATTTPTMNVNGLGAKTIVRPDGTAVFAGSLKQGYKREITYIASVDKFQLVDFGVDGIDADTVDGVEAAAMGQLGAAAEWTKRQNFNETSLTSSSGSIAWDVADNQVAAHTLTENTTIAAPSNAPAGTFCALRVTQHASAAKTLAWNSVFKAAGGTMPTMTSDTSAVDLYVFWTDGTNFYLVGYQQDLS